MCRWGTYVWGKLSQSEMSRWNVQGWIDWWAEMSGRNVQVGNVRIPMHDYNSLCVVVMTCATLVNTQTHTEMVCDRLHD